MLIKVALLIFINVLFLEVENTASKTLIRITSNFQRRRLNSSPLEIFTFSTLFKSLAGEKADTWKWLSRAVNMRELVCAARTGNASAHAEDFGTFLQSMFCFRKVTALYFWKEYIYLFILSAHRKVCFLELDQGLMYRSEGGIAYWSRRVNESLSPYVFS